MYKSFFGFKQAPFDKGIDSSMLFQSEAYKEVLARLDYLKTTRGFGLITGDPGVGKTSTLRVFADSLNPSLYKVMYFPMSSGTTMDFTGDWHFHLGNSRNSAKWSRSFRFRTPLPIFMISVASPRSLSWMRCSRHHPVSSRSEYHF